MKVGETCCCLQRNLWMAAGLFFFARKVKKSGTRTPWNSRGWFLANICTPDKKAMRIIAQIHSNP